MASSLIPEKPLLVSPSLAATIGLEEATMLSGLDELVSHRTLEYKNNLAWLTLNETDIARMFPFWTVHDIQRISKNLCDKGIIVIGSAPFNESRHLCFALNEKPNCAQQNTTIKTPEVHNSFTRGANRISPNWQPSDDVLKQIAQRNIPEHFIREQIPEFVTFWREKNEISHAWGNKFLKQVIHAWRNHETQFYRNESATSMNNQWQPSFDAMEVLVKHAGINKQFVEDAIPEFILYWQERGESSRTWNSKFIQHVRRQWNRYTATVENDTVPKVIPSNWQPGEDVFDVLRLANIDINFAKGLLHEFVIFWLDSKQVHTSWNTKFLQHVKFHWAKSHNSNNLKATAGGTQQANQRTRDRSLAEDLSDRSWAY
ncbi:DnaT-like ssDNA-binding domain-containing protein [Aurantivibrio infirmus]